MRCAVIGNEPTVVLCDTSEEEDFLSHILYSTVNFFSLHVPTQCVVSAMKQSPCITYVTTLKLTIDQ